MIREMQDITSALTLHSSDTAGPRHGEPLVVGIPISCGILTDQHQLCLIDNSGNRVPCDVTVLDRWPDRSARWALLSFRAFTNGSETSYRIGFVPKIGGSPEIHRESSLQISQKGDGINIDTGPIVFSLGSGGGWPIRGVFSAPNGEWLSRTGSGLHVEMSDGTPVLLRTEQVKIDSAGSIRVIARGSSIASLKSHRRLELEWFFEFFAGLPSVIVHIIIRNPHRAKHPSGFWELGDPGSMFLRETSLRLLPGQSTSCPNARCSPAPGSPMRPVKLPFEIYQDSSGGKNWQSRNHINRRGDFPLRFRGYRCSDASMPSGFRACPIAAIETAAGELIFASRSFWQNFPKAVEISESGLEYGLFPRQSSDSHELQGGEQKTYSFAISFGADTITEIPLDWFRQPLKPSIDPDWVEQSQAIPYLTSAHRDPHSVYLNLVNSALEGEDSFAVKREKIDEYGWRSFGDIYADHETIFAHDIKGNAPLVSHYNNQYDPIAGFCYQWLRSGNPDWWTHFCELAQHVIDIDIYHTDEDKAAYNHGLFWHTFHYVDAGRSTHRSYPNDGKANGGGPSSEHVYTTGLMLHYFITGNIASRDAATGLAQFIVDIDDGSKTVFRWFAKGNTGHASASRSSDYHGPGRGSGNSLNALLDGHRLTGGNRYLEKAEEIIRRVAHPEENIDRHNLLDAENRWFYTMFLQALGKYLDYKALLGQLDTMYAYARSTLLHYAHWMAENEYPYLEKPEILEYPTETWAAQDMRKSEVFKYALLHCEEKERKLFLERANHFFFISLSTLTEMKTRSLCRPVVILLSFGWMHAWFAANSDIVEPPPAQLPRQWPHQKAFLPQKSRALRNVTLAAAGAMIIMGIAWAIILCY